jgi:hypothetical protein
MMQMSVVPEQVAIKWLVAFSLSRPSWPGLSRPSTPLFLADAVKTWMPGTRPGMTERVVHFEQIML